MAEKSKELKDAKHKHLFLRIADEEKKHYVIMENIIEFITKPERWVENAEFGIREEYEHSRFPWRKKCINSY